jgi:hypothetical protein
VEEDALIVEREAVFYIRSSDELFDTARGIAEEPSFKALDSGGAAQPFSVEASLERRDISFILRKNDGGHLPPENGAAAYRGDLEAKISKGIKRSIRKRVFPTTERFEPAAREDSEETKLEGKRSEAPTRIHTLFPPQFCLHLLL